MKAILMKAILFVSAFSLSCTVTVKKKNSTMRKPRLGRSMSKQPRKFILNSQLRPSVWNAKQRKPIIISWKPRAKKIKSVDLIRLKGAKNGFVLNGSYPIFNLANYKKAKKLKKLDRVFVKAKRGYLEVKPSLVRFYGDRGYFLLKATATDGSVAYGKKIIYSSIDARLDMQKIKQIKQGLNQYTYNAQTGRVDLDNNVRSFLPSPGNNSIKKFIGLNLLMYGEEIQKYLGLKKLIKSDFKQSSLRLFRGQGQQVRLNGKPFVFTVMSINKSPKKTKKICLTYKNFCKTLKETLTLKINSKKQILWGGEIFFLELNDGSKHFLSVMDIEATPKQSDFIIFSYKKYRNSR